MTGCSRGQVNSSDRASVDWTLCAVSAPALFPRKNPQGIWILSSPLYWYKTEALSSYVTCLGSHG